MEEITKEKKIEDYPIPITIVGTNIILKQLINCACKIENKKGNGTGFFCSINDELKVLITNNHIIDEEIILKANKIRVTLNDDKDIKIINLNNKKYYTSEKYDIAILEIDSDKEQINDFLELDNNLLNNYNTDISKSVYLLQYPSIDYYKQKAAVSYGVVKNCVDEYNIIHYCCTDYGSSGSPILNSMNNKLIGIHKESMKNYNFNRGTLLSFPINEFLKKYNIYKDNTLISKAEENYTNYNNKSNEINLTLKIEKKDINKNIYFLNRDNDKYNIEEEYKKSIEYYNKLLNESKIKIFVNEKKYENKKYFLPEKTGYYEIKLKFEQDINNMSYMFYGCSKLTKINLSSFNTKNVVNMNSLFYNCSNLIKINLTSFDTINVTNMCSMFYQCSNLIELDLSSFNTKNVTNMSYMFCNCNNLTKINLSSFNTINVKDISSIFCNCSNLKELDLSSFNTKNVTNMSSMFCNCSNLFKLDLNLFDTINVENMNNMFSGCTKLKILDLSSFITTNVTNLNGMLSGCSELTSIDLSSFDIKNVIDISDIIFKCSNLKKVKINNIDSNNRLKNEFIGNNIKIIDKSGNNIN